MLLSCTSHKTCKKLQQTKGATDVPSLLLAFTNDQNAKGIL